MEVLFPNYIDNFKGLLSTRLAGALIAVFTRKGRKFSQLHGNDRFITKEKRDERTEVKL